MSSATGIRPSTAATPGAGSPSALLGVVTIVMTLLGWSSVPLFISHFAASIDLWTSNGWRYGFSALLWAPVIVAGWVRRDLRPGLWKASLVPALFNCAGQVAFTWSFYNIDAATATFGLRMQIVFVAAGAYLLFPTERAVLRRPAAWLGIGMVLMGTFGTMFLADPGAGPGKVAGGVASHPLGVVLSVLAGLFFACYALSVRKFMHGVHPVTAFAAISQLTAIVMVALMLALARDGHELADFGLSAWRLERDQLALLLVSAVIGIALGHVFYYISIARLGVAVSGGVVQLQPFCVALAQLWLFHKPMTSGQWGSGSVAVCGALLLLGVQWRVLRKVGRVEEAAVEEAGD